MRGIRLLSVGILAAVVIGAMPATAPAAPRVPESRTIRNWHAFTRLYGYVRWFCPSDEAAATDWDGLAIFGARTVRDLPDDVALRRALVELFTPIAPSLLIYEPGKTPPIETIAAPADSPRVAWQHQGVGAGAMNTNAYSPYKSLRVNRESPAAGAGFGTVTNQLDPTSLRGRTIRLRCAMRAEVNAGQGTGQMWLRVDRPGNATGLFDNMNDRPVTSAEWRDVEITGTVDADATSLYYGAFLQGSGAIEVDDFRLDVKRTDGSWESVPIANGGFEQASGADATGWIMPVQNYSGAFTTRSPREGRQSMRITRRETSGRLFDTVAGANETYEHELVSGLRCRLPLSVPSVGGHTQPEADVMALGRLRAELDGVRAATATADDEAVRVAGVVVLWNVTQHFWPYFDIVRPDWEPALDRALARSIHDHTPEDHAATLRLMTALLQDGHVNVRTQIRPVRAWTPLSLAWAEGRVVVADSADSLVRRGDVVRAIDGRDAKARLDSIMATRSGTERWRRNQALRLFDRGDPGSVARFDLERDGRKVAVEVPRSTTPAIPSRRLNPVVELEPGVWYVDLERSNMTQIDSVMTRLADAKGIVFDARGYPNGTHMVLCHLTDTGIQSAIWRVPRTIRPDRPGAAGWDESGRWTLPPMQPRIRARTAFLIGPGAISYAESVLGIVEAYHLGALVGEATAGTNGNINTFTLPGGTSVVWTGMQVVKHDGSEHMGVGIRPTIPVERTIAGIRAGRDEVLDRGLAIVRSGEPRP